MIVFVTSREIICLPLYIYTTDAIWKRINPTVISFINWPIFQNKLRVTSFKSSFTVLIYFYETRERTLDIWTSLLPAKGVVKVKFSVIPVCLSMVEGRQPTQPSPSVQCPSSSTPSTRPPPSLPCTRPQLQVTCTGPWPYPPPNMFKRVQLGPHYTERTPLPWTCSPCSLYCENGERLAHFASMNIHGHIVIIPLRYHLLTNDILCQKRNQAWGNQNTKFLLQ